MAVEAEPHKLAAKLTMALGMSGHRANMEKHVDAIKEHCETLAQPDRLGIRTVITGANRATCGCGRSMWPERQSSRGSSTTTAVSVERRFE